MGRRRLDGLVVMSLLVRRRGRGRGLVMVEHTRSVEGRWDRQRARLIASKVDCRRGDDRGAGCE
jgi:hypothetical protein